jgi:hypothetical protein
MELELATYVDGKVDPPVPVPVVLKTVLIVGKRTSLIYD